MTPQPSIDESIETARAERCREYMDGLVHIYGADLVRSTWLAIQRELPGWTNRLRALTFGDSIRDYVSQQHSTDGGKTWHPFSECTSTAVSTVKDPQ